MSKVYTDEQIKLIERTCKRDAAGDALQWCGVSLNLNEVEIKDLIKKNDLLWFLYQKYLNHKIFCDEHTHYYEFSSSMFVRKK